MKQREVAVGMYEMKKARCPNILVSEGIGPCIAIALYDEKTKSGYMMHQPNFEPKNLESKIGNIREDYKDLGRLRVLVTGSSMPFDK